jgi:hypothetical protein
VPIEFGLWRIDGELRRLTPSRLAQEARLEDVVVSNAGLLGLELLVLGHQVPTDFGSRIDVLGIDDEGDLYVVELKRDRTPREVVAQVLDYASWVSRLTYEQVKSLYDDNHANAFEQAFFERFGIAPPESVNEAHRLVIVASELDTSTERIVGYLAGSHGVPLNAVFFRYYEDEGHEYLARSWLIEPTEATILADSRSSGRRREEPWNGQDYYVAFGEGPTRLWTDAMRYGFVSGGGGPWYSRSLKALTPGARVFVHLPGIGYVGVGEVLGEAAPAKDAKVEVAGLQQNLLGLPHNAKEADHHLNDPEMCEWVVPVRWTKTLPREQAIWENGMFANQNTACKLRNQFTIDRLTERFGLDRSAGGSP